MKKIIAMFYFVPCYYIIETNELFGRNTLFDFMLTKIALPMHNMLIFLATHLDPSYIPNYPIKLNNKDLTNKDKEDLELL